MATCGDYGLKSPETQSTPSSTTRCPESFGDEGCHSCRDSHRFIGYRGTMSSISLSWNFTSLQASLLFLAHAVLCWFGALGWVSLRRYSDS